MQTTIQDGANSRHPTTRSSDDHVRISDDVELSDLADDGVAMKQAPRGTPNGDTVIQTKAQRLRARIQFATLCWTFYLAGWNDGTTGPLLPRIQKVYSVGVLVIVHLTDVDTRIA